MKNLLIKKSVASVLTISAWMARRENLNLLTKGLMDSLAQATIAIKKIRKVETLEELGKQWQRGFPSPKQVPIKEISSNTVYAEIHTQCPLRNTGDLKACYRMMRFDRAVVEKAGGDFVVLSSQATPGVSFCRVAIRKRGDDLSDLIPAHEKG